MKLCIILVLFFLPTVVFSSELVESDKIHLYFTHGVNSERIQELYYWEMASGWIIVDIDFDDVNAIVITDSNIENGYCVKTKKRKRETLFTIHSVNQPLSSFHIPFSRPCVKSNAHYSKYIEIMVKVKTQNGAYYKTFTLYNKRTW